MIDVNELK